MDIWMTVSTYDYTMYATAHLTKGGAYFNMLTDIMSFCDLDDDEEFGELLSWSEASEFDAHALKRMTNETDPSMLKSTALHLLDFAIETGRMDSGSYDIEVIRSRVQP